jgi:eukaryotic-like serine/threonine-protein kinase
VPLLIPPDLERALAEVPSARAHFDRLPSEGKDAWIAWIGRTRVPGARRRRIQHALRKLGAPSVVVGTEERVEAPPLPPAAAWWPWLLAAALLLFVAALLVWVLVFRGNGHRTVPDFVGQTLASAQRTARQADLNPVVTMKAANRPQGIVVDQRPSPGTVVRRGALVTLVVSRGARAKPVPDVAGLVALDAAARLRAAGFVPKLVEVQSPKTQGTVVSQKPAAGAEAPTGSRVSLLVSAGLPGGVTTTVTTTTTAPATTPAQTTRPATTPTQPAGAVAVPSLIGTGFATALNALEQAGLLATVKYQTSQSPVGQVRGQNPVAGTKVPQRTRVLVNAAEGPNPGNPAQLSDVTGEDEATARSDLESAGFQVVVIHTTRGGGRAGTVIEQQPAAGTTISTGDFVAIYVP